MWALVESGSITKMWSRPQAFSIGDTQYPANTMTLWSESQLQSIGVYPVTIDNTNLKDTNYYINTDITYTVDGLTVKGAYGTATALSLTDSLYTQEDEDAGLGTKDDVKQDGLKSKHKDQVNVTANGLLKSTDWYSLRAADGGTAVPSNIATYRAAIRTKANTHTTAIDNAADIDALAALVYDWPELGS